MHSIAAQVEGCMTMSTTRKTRDPYIIMKARDLIKLLSTCTSGIAICLIYMYIFCFPAFLSFSLCYIYSGNFGSPLFFLWGKDAIKILNDEMQCNIIKMNKFVHTCNLQWPTPTLLQQERFVKRRQHLVGPNSSTLKALEILTGCYILVQVHCLKQVRRVLEDCIQNKMHPVYHVKQNCILLCMHLVFNFSICVVTSFPFINFFTSFKVKSKEKKPYTPFPPPQPLSKVDLQLESGEYFLGDQKKFAKKWQHKLEKQTQKNSREQMKKRSCICSSHGLILDKSADDKNDVAAMAMSLRPTASLQRWLGVENISQPSWVSAKFRRHHFPL
ncbi:hypothetical protein AAG906_006007 [Vitis piasezkii]